jgi:hypothetical protein
MRFYRPPGRIDFGDVISGLDVTRDLIMLNRGSGTLTLQTTSDNPAASLSFESLRVPAGQRRLVTLRVHVPAAGTATGHVDILSDDPDRPDWSIPWSLEAHAAPVLSVAPEAITETLTAGTERTVSLSLANPGAFDLSYTVTATPASSDWLVFSPVSGVVPGGTEKHLPVILRAGANPPGDYSGSLRITSNAPGRPEVVVPITLTLLPSPSIRLDEVTGTLTSIHSFFADGEETRHSFPVDAATFLRAVIFVLVEGDYNDPGERAEVRLEGAVLGTVSGTSAACAVSSGTYSPGDSLARQAAADGVFRVSVANTTSVQASCPSSRHRVDLAVTSSPTRIDFGSIRPGEVTRRVLKIRNGGQIALAIARVSIDGGPFSAALATTMIAPGATTTLTLEYRPTVPGEDASSVTIEGNDPGFPSKTVPLTGRAPASSSARVEPEAPAIRVQRFLRGSIPLTLFNDGEGPLNFRIGTRAGPPPSPDAPLPGRLDELPGSPVPLSAVAGDPRTGIVYGIQDLGSRFFRLRPGAGSWEPLASSPLATLDGASAAVLGGKIYVTFGGLGIASYDTARDSWETFRPLPAIVGSAIASDGLQSLYLAYSTSFVLFDPATGSIDPLPPFPGGMDSFGSMAFFQGSLYAHRGSAPYTFARYDIAKAAWTSLPSIPAVPPLPGATFDEAAGEYLVHGSGRILYRFSTPTSKWSAWVLDMDLARGGLAWVPGPIPGAVIVQGRGGTRAMRFDGGPPLLRADPLEGVIPPGGSTLVTLAIDPSLRQPGDYQERLVVETDALDQPAIERDVTIRVVQDRDGDEVDDADDNCPDRTNPGQEDADSDGLGDACDNCPEIANATQADADTDAIGDACDGCNDIDGDGAGGPGSRDCPVDNCPGVANQDQADRDADGVGDACDPCDDPDHDGTADLDGAFRACPLDTCPGLPNPGQEDRDGDGRGDACDSCPDDPAPDVDGDGVCFDNCPSAANPAQEDTDGDGMGDACDDCPMRADSLQVDRDGDRIGDLCDLCPRVADPGQRDADDDLVGDACDNCPEASNPNQEDADEDGSGDACQPTLRIDQVVEDGGDRLEVRLRARDPQDDALTGSLTLFRVGGAAVTLGNVLPSLSCDTAWLPLAQAGAGIGYVWSQGYAALFDLDSNLGCGDGLTDFLIAPGSCDQPRGLPDSTLDLSGLSPPVPLCIHEYRGNMTTVDASIESWDDATLRLSTGTEVLVAATPAASPLPRRLEIGDLVPGSSYRLVIEATDGRTRPVRASTVFRDSGERLLVINTPPKAGVLWPAAALECAGPGGTEVMLDGSPSRDDDDLPGAPDIVSYEWLENPGTPEEVVLGIGARLAPRLPLGTHQLGLRVTDSIGESAEAKGTVTVADTRAPALTVAASPAVLWPPNHRLVPVTVTWQALDACSGDVSVRLISVRSSEPDDAPGGGDGNTTGDIAGAIPGTADAALLLRAERSVTGPGRFYTLVYAAADGSGHEVQGEAVVKVPNEDRKRTVRSPRSGG